MIPHELTLLRQWVNWRLEADGKGEPTKVPYNPLTGYHASHSSPHTWLDYATVSAAMSTGHYTGIGFVLSKNDPYTFIDLDNPWKIDPPNFEESQRIAERHTKILEMMDSYAEWSPSGKGMHIIVRGSVPAGVKRKQVEVYSELRYMTMTGNTYINKPIVDRSDVLGEFYKELAKGNINLPIIEGEQEYDDYTIYERMMKASNGELALDIWNGDSHGKTGDGTHSAGDQALINLLQFYTHNTAQITRMFLASPRAARIVSGEKRKFAKYIPNMILKSFDREVPDIDFSQLRMPELITPEPLPMQLAVIEPVKAPIVFPAGLMGEIAQYIYDQAALPVAEVALTGAIALMAGICGRAYNVSDEGLNLYILLLALTGVGKEAASKGIGKLMTAVEEIAPAATSFRGPAEIASGPALTKFLAHDSPCCFSILGEFGLRLHQMCNDQAQSHMIGLRRVLLDLYHKSGKGASIRPHVYSDKEKNTEVLHSPAFTIFGESTPDTFYRHLDESMLSDGLLPRFIVIEYTGDRVELNDDFGKVQVSKELATRVAELATFCIQMHHANRVSDVQLSPEALRESKRLSKDYTARINANRQDQIGRQLYNRAHLKILKLAALVAVGINPVYPLIQVEYIEWARAWIDGDIANVLSKFQNGKVGKETGDVNQMSEMGECLTTYLRRDWEKNLKKLGVPVIMHQNKVVTYQYIQRQCANRAAFRQDRMGATFALGRTLGSLIASGAIREIKPSQLEKEFNTIQKAYAIVDISQLQQEK